MASVAFATQELFEVCTNTSATSSTENWWVFAQWTEKRIFLSTFTCWRLTRLTGTRFEAKRPRPERTERRKGAAEAQRGEDHISVYVAPLRNWRRSAKVVLVDRESIFHLSAALVSVSVPSGYHMMPSLHSFPESYVV